jgi:hypothetical protein
MLIVEHWPNTSPFPMIIIVQFCFSETVHVFLFYLKNVKISNNIELCSLFHGSLSFIYVAFLFSYHLHYTLIECCQGLLKV